MSGMRHGPRRRRQRAGNGGYSPAAVAAPGLASVRLLAAGALGSVAIMAIPASAASAATAIPAATLTADTSPATGPGTAAAPGPAGSTPAAPGPAGAVPAAPAAGTPAPASPAAGSPAAWDAVKGAAQSLWNAAAPTPTGGYFRACLGGCLGLGYTTNGTNASSVTFWGGEGFGVSFGPTFGPPASTAEIGTQARGSLVVQPWFTIDGMAQGGYQFAWPYQTDTPVGAEATLRGTVSVGPPWLPQSWIAAGGSLSVDNVNGFQWTPYLPLAAGYSVPGTGASRPPGVPSSVPYLGAELSQVAFVTLPLPESWTLPLPDWPAIGRSILNAYTAPVPASNDPNAPTGYTLDGIPYWLDLSKTSPPATSPGTSFFSTLMGVPPGADPAKPTGYTLDGQPYWLDFSKTAAPATSPDTPLPPGPGSQSGPAAPVPAFANMTALPGDPGFTAAGPVPSAFATIQAPVPWVTPWGDPMALGSLPGGLGTAGGAAAAPSLAAPGPAWTPPVTQSPPWPAAAPGGQAGSTADQAPVQQVPAQQAPVQQAPAQAPVQQAPVQQPPVQAPSAPDSPDTQPGMPPATPGKQGAVDDPGAAPAGVQAAQSDSPPVDSAGDQGGQAILAGDPGPAAASMPSMTMDPTEA